MRLRLFYSYRLVLWPLLFSWAALTTVSAQDVVISEFMGSNFLTAVPGDTTEHFYDWIELHNRSASSVDLSGWFLTDDSGIPFKWTLPSSVIPAGGYKVVMASDTAIPVSGLLHTNFSLSARGGYLALIRPDFTEASTYDYPKQFVDVSYGLLSGSGLEAHLANSSPAQMNGSVEYLFVRDTSFSHKRGHYETAFSVTITTTTAGATIRYTMDGSEPTLDSGMAYTGPVLISTTTVLRARAYLSGHAASNIDTQTYVFPNAVLDQVRPSDYPTSWGSKANADYEMDPNISQDPNYSSRLLDGLSDLPTLSVVTDRDAIFGFDGIYSNPLNRDLEVAASAEYFQPTNLVDGTNIEDGFQINCGLKIQGGSSRNPSRSPKHSFSLRFRSIYGESALRYKLFPDSSIDEFNGLHLRAMYNNSWIHFDPNQRSRATMIRDQWIRDSLIAMGQDDGGRGDYVNLYLNGLYWGVYNLHERPDNHHYAAYNGGDPDTIDNHNPLDSTPSFTYMVNVVETGSWSDILSILDVDSYIDFYLIQHFGHNEDLKLRGNWRATGGGSSGALWRIYAWDTERVLENVGDISSLENIYPVEDPRHTNEDGLSIIDDLVTHEEFRIRFADRVQKHLFNDGALTAAANLARWTKYADRLDRAIIGESARWGDWRRPYIYTRDQDWIDEINHIKNNFFNTSPPNRTSVMVNKILIESWSTGDGKFLNAATPAFEVNSALQHGGSILSTDNLGFSTIAGTIYYTTDDSDPRCSMYTCPSNEGGSISASAVAFNVDFQLLDSATIRARTLNGNEWSPLIEASFIVEPLASVGDLVITEINYHPADPIQSELAAGAALSLEDDSFEFIELMNVAPNTINLEGVNFVNGISFTFESLVVASGERIILTKDLAAFRIRYGDLPGVQVVAGYSGTLSNGGEVVDYATASGQTIQVFEYDDKGSWPGRADGAASTLELVSLLDNPNQPSSWRSSSEFNGSPGSAGLGPDNRVVINEVLAHTDLPEVDSIELYNTTGSAIDISNWFLSDTRDDYLSYSIPAGTILLANGFIVFDEYDFNSSGTVADFALSSSSGDDVYLVSANAEGAPVGFVDHAEFDASFNGVTFGRWPDGEGRFVPMISNTLSGPNSGPVIADIIISEIMYHPTLEQAYEFVELYNRSNVTVGLENWSLRGGSDFNFTSSHQIAAGERVLLVGFDATDSVITSAFRAIYGLGPSAQLWGPLDGGLDNSGDVVRLRRPDDPPVEDPNLFPQVLADIADFNDSAPWPLSADGLGSSLQRILPVAYGSFPSSWEAFGTGAGQAPYYIDLDHDGVHYLIEYALNLDPNAEDADQLPKPQIQNGNLIFNYPLDLTKLDISYQVEGSNNLQVWTPVSDALISTSGSIQMRQFSMPIADESEYFLRLRIQSP